MAIREYQAGAARAAREAPFGRDDARKRPGLTAHEDPANEAGDHERRRKRAMANAIEALLFRPELFESDAENVTAAFEQLEEPMRALMELARTQWTTTQRYEGAALLEACPNDRVRAWVGERLMPAADDDRVVIEHCRQQLTESVATLRACELAVRTHKLKQVSARAGLQGDPGAELGTLNEQLQLRRELARTRSK
jgi:hypothetical protein